MSTRKIGVGSLAEALQGADNWLNPVVGKANLPLASTVPAHSGISVSGDAVPEQNGLYFNENNQWVQRYSLGAETTNVFNAYQHVVTSDTVDALPPLVDSFGAAGGTVFLQAGLHYLTTLVLNVQASRLTLLGEGPATVLVIDHPTATTLLQFAGALEALELLNMTLVVDPAVVTANTVVQVASTAPTHHLRIAQCFIQGNVGTAFQLNTGSVVIEGCVATTTQPAATFVALGADVSRVTLRNNEVTGYQTFCQGATTATALRIEGNTWDAPDASPSIAAFLTGQGTNDVTLAGNTITLPAGVTSVTPMVSFVDGTQPGRFLLENNLITAPYGVSIQAQDDTATGFVLANRFVNAACAVDVVAPACTQFQLANNKVLAGEDATAELLRVASDAAMVHGNTLQTQGQVGIRVLGNYCAVLQNSVRSDVPGSPAPAIKIFPNNGEACQLNQVLFNMVNRPIEDAGVLTVQASNMDMG